MKPLRIGTRITLWSALVVTVGIAACGTASTIYVYRQERNELDDELKAEAKRFFAELRSHGGSHFDWQQQTRQVRDWLPATVPPRLVEVATPHNHILYRSKNLTNDALAKTPQGFHDLAVGENGLRVGVFKKDGLTLRIAGDREEVTDLAEDLATAFLLMLPPLIVFVILGGRFIAHKALSPIQRITAFAEDISVQNLDQRIPLPPAKDEIWRLAGVLNKSFDRLERSFHQASRFSADASHQLKTPLTVMRMNVEALLRSSALDSAVQQSLSSILEETKRLSSVTECLLLLSRADAGKLALDLQPGDLAEVIAYCADDAAIIAESRGIHLEREFPAPAPAMIDQRSLAQILMNLLDNALKYNRPGGRIRVALATEGGAWKLSISNTGRGIAPENIPHLFTRFYRGAHTGDISGQGLGLGLALELARAHHGDLVLAASEEDLTTFVLTLPKPESNPLSTAHSQPSLELSPTPSP